MLVGIGVAAAVVFGLPDRPADPRRMPPVGQTLRPELRVEVLGRDALTTGTPPLAWTATGRYVPLDGGLGLRHQWPGLVLSARFIGEVVLLGFDDPENRFRLRIDGEEVALITRPGQATLRVHGLGRSIHSLRLERLSEAGRPADIVGLAVPAADTPLPPAPLPPRRIDVFGNSDTVGYANLSENRSCPAGNVFLTTDTTRAWPTVLAESYGATANVNAQSGLGLIRNYGGWHPTVSMTSLWRLILPARPEAGLETDVPLPWLTIVALGDNDFSVPLRADERWPDQAALKADFEVSFEAFLRDLLDRAGGRPIIVLTFADAGVPAHPLMEGAVAELAAEGATVVLARQGKLERTACDWHPTLADHEALTETFVDTIEGLISTGLLERP